MQLISTNLSFFRKTNIHGLMAVLFFMGSLISIVAKSQANVKVNCLQPFELDFSKDRNELYEEKYIKYSNHDEHTFWYKINTKESEKFAYSFSSLDGQDNFDIYFYQYEGNNFCRNLIQENLELISFDRNLELKSDRNSTYYLGVYPLFPGGCGHEIDFKYAGINLSLRSENAEKDCSIKSDQEIIEELPEESRVVISGYVIDEVTGNRINASLSFADPFTGHKINTECTEENGFSVSLSKDGDYKVLIQSFGYLDNITALSAYNGEEHEFAMKWSGKKSYILNKVYFYPNTYALKDESKTELQGVYSYLKNRTGIRIEIIGHTNGNKDVRAGRMVNEKGEEWNFVGSAKELSQRRAYKIVKFLEGKGIDSRIMEAKGMGGDQMIVENPSSMKEAMLNIRVEIKILTD